MANNGKPTASRTWLTRSYNFIDKDPEIDVFRTIYQKEHIKEGDLAVLAGLSVNTVKNMFGGETRRPQHATFAKMAGAMGYKYGLQRDEAPDYEAELPAAKEQFKKHKEALKRMREQEEANEQRARKRRMKQIARDKQAVRQS